MKKYFEDIHDDEHLYCQPYHVTREAILEFGREYDPQPFHIDEQAAQDSIFSGLIASALHTMAVCTRVVVDAQGDMAIMSGLGIEEVRLFTPVRPDDVLQVEAWWAELRRSRSKPDRGIATLKCKMSNQRGELVMETGYRYLIACRNSTSTT